MQWKNPRTCQLGFTSDGSKKKRGIFNLGLNREGKRNEGRNLNVYNGFKTQKVESWR